jgi:hypothetical protein
VPAKEPEPLTFGVKAGEADMHSFGELAVAPVQRAAAHVAQSLRVTTPLPRPAQFQRRRTPVPEDARETRFSL